MEDPTVGSPSADRDPGAGGGFHRDRPGTKPLPSQNRKTVA